MTESEQKKKESKDSIIYRVFHSPIFVAATGAGVIMMALAFDRIKDNVSVEGVVAGAGILLFITTMNMIINASINKLHNQDYFDSRLEVLDSMILNNNLQWLVNQKYVQMLESQADEIWAFAPELTYSIQPGTEIFKAVQDTLAHGCKYKIFMPNRPETHKIIADYRRLHKFKSGQIEFILIPHEEYVFHTIISLYNPGSDHPRAIEWLPVEGLVAWLEMDPKHASSMVGIGEVLIKRYMEASGGVSETDLVKQVPRGSGHGITERA